MKQIEIAGVPIKIQWNEPTQEEIEEAETSFNALYASGSGSNECDEFEAAMNSAGYMCSWDEHEQRFLFIPY